MKTSNPDDANVMNPCPPITLETADSVGDENRKTDELMRRLYVLYDFFGHEQTLEISRLEEVRNKRPNKEKP